MKKLAIITSHPIQYNAPWFKMLTDRGKVQVKVFYTWYEAKQGVQFDPDFGKHISWDLPLLDGYDYTFVKNKSKHPGSSHFWGLINPTLNKEVNDWVPDAILVIRWSFHSHLQSLRHFHKKIPLLTRGDSTLLDLQRGWKKMIRSFVLKYVYNHVDFALYVGTNSKSYFEAYGFDEKALWNVPHAVENERFYETEKTKAEGLEWRNKLAIPPYDIVFLFAGKLEPKKNPELLLDAFCDLASTNIHLVVVGNGVKEQPLKEKYGVNKEVHFLDFKNQSEMPGIYNMSDVFILPSQGPEETWGLALNEAMANKRVVIASTRCGGAIDLIENGKNGYIFESGDMQDLKDKMVKVIKQKDHLKEMGKNSLRIIEAFSFERICDQIEQLMENKI